jgi:hypothetical protein
MRIYLDNCCLQRPSDDQRRPRVRVESEALYAILAAVQNGEISLCRSEALEYEIGLIPSARRRNQALAVLELASEQLFITPDVVLLAKSFILAGVKDLDALHLALASLAKVEFFCTSDDRLLRRSRQLNGLECKPVSLLELVQEVFK